MKNKLNNYLEELDELTQENLLLSRVHKRVLDKVMQTKDWEAQLDGALELRNAVEEIADRIQKDIALFKGKENFKLKMQILSLPDILLKELNKMIEDAKEVLQNGDSLDPYREKYEDISIILNKEINYLLDDFNKLDKDSLIQAWRFHHFENASKQFREIILKYRGMFREDKNLAEIEGNLSLIKYLEKVADELEDKIYKIERVSKEISKKAKEAYNPELKELEIKYAEKSADLSQEHEPLMLEFMELDPLASKEELEVYGKRAEKALKQLKEVKEELKNDKEYDGHEGAELLKLQLKDLFNNMSESLLLILVSTVERIKKIEENDDNHNIIYH